MVCKINNKDGKVNYCECSIKFLVYLDEIRSKEYNFLYTILYFGKAEETL